MSLSTRATAVSSSSSGSLLWEVTANQWHEDTNPSGYVSLGMAENALMQKSLCDRMAAVPHISPRDLTYGDGTTGSKHLKEVLATFLTRYFHTCGPVNANHITVTNGCSAALEHLAWAFGDAGDCFLVGRPFFRAFVPNTELRVDSKLIPVPCYGADPFGLAMIDQYEKTLLEARKTGQRVKGVILCTPHNPMGRCYSKEVIIELMKLCAKYNLHLISDEVYALSTWENDIDTKPATVPFTSCLSVDTTGIISQSQVHVVWGVSKDFGSNGIRMGAVISRANPQMHKALVPGALYSMSSSLANHVYANILGDFEWIDNYLAENRSILKAHYEIVADWAQTHQIRHAPGANAAFFIWLQLGDAYGACHPGRQIIDNEKDIMNLMLEEKVFVAPGQSFGSEENGWFRVVFSVDRINLIEGLKRILKALNR